MLHVWWLYRAKYIFMEFSQIKTKLVDDQDPQELLVAVHFEKWKSVISSFLPDPVVSELVYNT